MRRISSVLLEQRGSLFEWVPVCMAIGIGIYFLLRFEPTMPQLWSVAGGAVALLLAARWLGEAFRPLVIGLVIVASGFLLAAHRAHDVASPVMSWRYYGPVEGRVVNLDRSSSDALRITLDQVVLERVPPHRTPERVRISLHGDQSLSVLPAPGLRVMTTAHVSPPGGPVEPGGFDFQRHAWFGQLGGVGYSRVPLLAIAPPEEDRWELAVFRIRMAIGARMLQVLPGDVGGFAVAVTTGARSSISQQALDDLRASNLAHLLAISGLHMGLLTGFVFALLRVTIALIPPLALRVPARKLAAGGALIVAAGYLALSGGNVATERAFIMVAVALSAVMLNRRAISLRAVAIAAVIVLLLRPEALLGPGFQMSFAATTALVAVFGYMRDHRIGMGPNWAKPVVAVLISSGVAGLATAPIGAAHFNAISHYGLIANLTSVPMMGTVVIPAAVLALILAPLGLDWIGLWIMGVGLRWILEVGSFVAGLDGARSFVHGPGLAVLPMIALGFLWLCLWQGRTRLVGGLPLVAAFGLWALAERPVGLIAENGTLVGVMTPEGRALSKARGAGFIAQNWLENDGEATDQTTAAARWPETRAAPLPGGVALTHLAGKAAVAAFEGCSAGQIVVANQPLPAVPSECLLLDPDRLRDMGAVAILARRDGVHLVSTRDRTGDRLWTPWYQRAQLQ
ncbi:ComEC/Rec2 family competence protein [Roseobacter sinensis]|uniref:ComEC/Rec2 family competence protein n=1 Tax=Roseobacter sinensis TaxID=2931391 RepID=A0ABT3BFN1_9RHOB|nr:ComEC/Rec2 family competence protein [Roseobacter sp. WL0113]MCV3272395.1 ComEC/Rec2 family competence protein [Roseobacter sp. WL0113]